MCSTVSEVLAAYERATSDLVDTLTAPGTWDGLDRPQVTDLVLRLEAQRQRLLAVDAHAADAFRRIVVPPVETLANGRERRVDPVAALRDALRISAGEARDRYRLADAVLERRALDGQQLPPRREALATAVRDGDVGGAQADVVVVALDRIERDLGDEYTPDAVVWAEQLLLGQVDMLGPAYLRKMADDLFSRLCPDGPEPRDDRDQQVRRDLTLRRTRDGMWQLTGRLTAETGEKLEAVLTPLAAPHTRADRDAQRMAAEGGGPECSEFWVDRRTPEQRRHDALDDVADRLLRSGSLPDHGGIATTLVVTMTAEQYTAGTAPGRTASGGRLSPDAVRRLTDTAEILAAVVDEHGVPLALGRDKRLPDRRLTAALHLRDEGCTYPGCGRPPAWCQRHHIVDWQYGGPTDLSNLTLLCGHHHRTFDRHGWTVRIGRHGLPEWVPPAWVDPDRRPVLHHRFHTRLAGVTPALTAV